MTFKITISDPKSRKAWQVEKEWPTLIGKTLGERIDGSPLGLDGYTLQITGG
ncbi:MAG: S6e family ribosomal protein, partial [Candidatus Aenigmatarchaeota archaeon]